MAARVDDGKPLSAQRRSYAACFALLIKEARALAPHEVIEYPGDADLALVNARTGTDAACADREAIETHLPQLSYDKAVETPDAARAVIYAVLRSNGAPAPKEQQRPVVVQRVKAQRRHMVNSARSLVDKGKLPADKVAQLGRTRGNDGLINDALLVSELFLTHSTSIAGMHPFTEKDLESLRTDAEWLRENTRPSDARRPVVVTAAATSDRDRLWTVLVRRHAMLRQIAGYFHPDDVNAVVPPLRSRVRGAAATSDEVVDRPPVNPPTG